MAASVDLSNVDKIADQSFSYKVGNLVIKLSQSAAKLRGESLFSMFPTWAPKHTNAKAGPAKNKVERLQKRLPQNANGNLLQKKECAVEVWSSYSTNTIVFDYYYFLDKIKVSAWVDAAAAFVSALDDAKKQEFEDDGKYRYFIEFNTFGLDEPKKFKVYSTLKTSYFLKYFELAVYNQLKPQNLAILEGIEQAKASIQCLL